MCLHAKHVLFYSSGDTYIYNQTCYIYIYITKILFNLNRTLLSLRATHKASQLSVFFFFSSFLLVFQKRTGKFFLPMFHHSLSKKQVNRIWFISLNILANVFASFLLNMTWQGGNLPQGTSIHKVT